MGLSLGALKKKKDSALFRNYEINVPNFSTHERKKKTIRFIKKQNYEEVKNQWLDELT